MSPLTSRTSLDKVTVTPDSYRLPDGSERVRVTRIIGTLAKPVLDNWGARLAAEYAVGTLDVLSGMDTADAVTLVKHAPTRYTEKASELGTRVHAAVEDTLLTGSSIYDQPADLLGHLRGWQAFLDLYQPEVLGVEVLFAGPGYAGTADLILRVDLGDGKGPQIVMADVKSGKSVHAESVALQLAAYRFAPHIVLEGRLVPNPWLGKVTDGLVIHLRPRSAGTYVTRCDEAVYRHFQYAQQSFLWVNTHSEKALSPRQTLDPKTVPATPTQGE